jgi:hypothetical protein
MIQLPALLFPFFRKKNIRNKSRAPLLYDLTPGLFTPVTAPIMYLQEEFNEKFH